MNKALQRPYRWILLSLCLCLLFLTLSHCSLARERRERALLPTIGAAALEFGVPRAMILAVIRTESDFKTGARSEAGALGLMQLLPETFRWLYEERLQEPLTPEQITDPEVNIRYGTYYLAYLFERFGDWRIALAAYNAGEGRVAQWLQPDGMLGEIPFPETAAYVQKTLEAYQLYSQKYPL